MTDATSPTGITVAVAERAQRAERLAAALGAAYAIGVSNLHVDPVVSFDDHTPEEALATRIADAVPADHLLVVESQNADRWRSRHSVAEHIIDAHENMTIAIGPKPSGDLAPGPVVVALDGSTGAETALPPTRALAEAIERSLLLVRVVPAALHPTPETSDNPTDLASAQLGACAESFDLDAEIVVVESNDPVSALVSVAHERAASFIALSSSGDRERARTTMSRTAAGLIAEADCPVFITHSGSS